MWHSPRDKMCGPQNNRNGCDTFCTLMHVNLIEWKWANCTCCYNIIPYVVYTYMYWRNHKIPFCKIQSFVIFISHLPNWQIGLILSELNCTRQIFKSHVTYHTVWMCVSWWCMIYLRFYRHTLVFVGLKAHLQFKNVCRYSFPLMEWNEMQNGMKWKLFVKCNAHLNYTHFCTLIRNKNAHLFDGFTGHKLNKLCALLLWGQVCLPQMFIRINSLVWYT